MTAEAAGGAEAIEQFWKALVAEPSYTPVLWNLALLLAYGPDPKLRDPRQAIGLAKKGIVQTQRGVGGGISLAKSPEELTILDVVNAVGQTQSTTINLKAGTYQFICRFHVSFGMKGTLIVTG